MIFTLCFSANTTVLSVLYESITIISSAKLQSTTDPINKRSYWETQADKYFAAGDSKENAWNEELNTLLEGKLDKESAHYSQFFAQVFWRARQRPHRRGTIAEQANPQCASEARIGAHAGRPSAMRVAR